MKFYYFILFVLWLLMDTEVFSIKEKPVNKIETTTKYVAPKDNWGNMKKAIIHVESKGNERAVSKDGSSVGIFQIKRVVIDDCNRILQLQGKNKRYNYKDRYNPYKSHEIFELMQNYYNKEKNIHEAIKIWNGGANYKSYYKNNDKRNIKRINNYYNKVIAVYNKM